MESLKNAACLSWASWRVIRKEPSTNTVAQVWMALLSQTRQESGDHNRLSESCNNVLIQPLAQSLEYTQRLAKKVLMSALWGGDTGTYRMQLNTRMLMCFSVI